MVNANNAERLVRDRFAEFKRVAQSRGTLSMDSSGKDPIASMVPRKPGNMGLGGKSAFMREFFDAINDIQASLNNGRANVKQMGIVLEERLNATTQAKEQEASDRINELVQETGEYIQASKVGLHALQTKADNNAGSISASEQKIQANMRQAMAKKHQQLLLDFQQAQIDFKRVLEQKQMREMAVLMPELTEDERADMIEAGQTTSLIVATKMAGAHALLLDEVQQVRDKHQDILRLEQNIADLAAMFKEMAVLVDSQGELLDAIEVHVHKTNECTAKGEQNLITARKVQHKTQKQLCCMTVVVMIIAIVILAPILKS